MAITLGGTKQVECGTGAIYQSRPWTTALLVKRTGTGFAGLFCDGANTSRGYNIYLDSNGAGNKINLIYNTPTLYNPLSSFAVASGTGWWLLALVIRDNGSNTAVDFFGYRYDTSTLNVSSTTMAVDANPSAPNGTDKVVVGDDKSGSNWPGDIGWAGVFAGDLGNSGSSTAPQIWELITRGPWGMLDSNCKFFMPLSNAAQDLSGNARHGTLVGSPSYTGSGPTELPPFQPIYINQSSPALTVTLSGYGSSGEEPSGSNSQSYSSIVSPNGTPYQEPSGVVSSVSALSLAQSGSTDTEESSGASSHNLTSTLTGAGSVSSEQSGVATLSVTLSIFGSPSLEQSGNAGVSIAAALPQSGSVSGEQSGVSSLSLSATLPQSGSATQEINGVAGQSASAALNQTGTSSSEQSGAGNLAISTTLPTSAKPGPEGNGANSQQAAAQAQQSGSVSQETSGASQTFASAFNTTLPSYGTIESSTDGANVLSTQVALNQIASPVPETTGATVQSLQSNLVQSGTSSEEISGTGVTSETPLSVTLSAYGSSATEVNGASRNSTILYTIQGYGSTGLEISGPTTPGLTALISSTASLSVGISGVTPLQAELLSVDVAAPHTLSSINQIFTVSNIQNNTTESAIGQNTTVSTLSETGETVSTVNNIHTRSEIN